METEKKTRKPRSDRGPRLTSRDLLALLWIAEQYAIRLDQLRYLLGHYAKAETKEMGVLSESATRHTVDRWELAGLVEYKKILAEEPGYVWLTKAGLKLIDSPFGFYAPKLGHLKHIYWCNQVRLWVMEQSAWTTKWISERWDRSQLDQQNKQVDLPDARLETPTGDTIVVEIELSQKSAIRLEEGLRDLTLVYDQIYYFVADGKVRRAVEAAWTKLEPYYQSRIKIYSLPEGYTYATL